ncbi:response regulator [Haliangium sp.]|uniref:response regulator n=1 Tax=Haliangium sp. TaxID=2663208 RepID=UPI003D0EDF38
MSGGRILIVDHEPAIQGTLGRFLEEEGYEIDYCPSGREALARIAERPPDAVLLDLLLPGMSGREFIATLRDSLGFARLPVLMMTGLQGLAPSQALAMGANDVIEEPFDIDEILNKVALAMFRTGHPPGGAEHHEDGMDDAAAEWNEAVDETTFHMGVVIVVESDLTLRRHLDTVLGSHGYRVVAMGQASDDLFRLARVLEPRAVVIGLEPQRTEGLDALRELRAMPELDRVAVLLWSDDKAAVEAARSHAFELAAELRPKPVADEALLAFVADPPTHARRATRASE